MENQIEIIFFEEKYLEDVILLLQENKLPYEDIDIHFVDFILAKKDNKIVGAIGLERYHNIGLLRSFAVNKLFRNRKIGNKLLNFLLRKSFDEGIKNIYLLTTTADRYFLNKGFKVEDRDSLPDVIKQTKEFSSICPLSAVAMSKKV